jgi:hypothetical protein
VIARIENHLGELFPHVGFIVTTLTGTNRPVIRFYNQRGTVVDVHSFAPPPPVRGATSSVIIKR